MIKNLWSTAHTGRFVEHIVAALGVAKFIAIIVPHFAVRRLYF